MDSKYLKLSESLKLVMFSGKGGVGKTTCSCSAALYCAGRGQRTLLASTDPAHSLADSLDIPIGREVTPVAGIKNLYAVEIDAMLCLEEFKQKYGDILKKIADRGTYFDREDINEFFALSLPGLDELMGILTLTDHLEGREYDVIVLDTAPTGHTVRLLGLPEQMADWIRVMDLMLEKHRYMASVFGRYVPDDTDAFIKFMNSRVSKLKKLMTDPIGTQFIPVVIPEPMSINETGKLVKVARSKNIPLTQMIVNRVASDRECVFCRSRKADQVEKLKEIENRFKMINRIELPLLSHEIRGIPALTAFSGRMFNPDCCEVEGFVKLPQGSDIVPASVCLSAWEPAGKKYILIGGKGGVGKTSVAAAMGMYLAEQGKRVLIFSTDPAHSLSDSYSCQIGNRITPLAGNTCLYGFEIDPEKMLDEFKQQYLEEINEVFDGFLGGRGMNLEFDREVMTELITLAPPGLDEVMALLKLMELSEENDYDVIILDTAPTGHLIRMLEMPELARQWFKTFFKLVLKYSGVVDLRKTTELMLEMSRGVRRLQKAFANPDSTAFVGVTVPEAMIFAETERLMQGIKRLGINSRWIAVNMVIPASRCRFCSRMRAQQQNYLARLYAGFADCKIIEIPLFPHQISGIDDLKNLFKLRL